MPPRTQPPPSSGSASGADLQSERRERRLILRDTLALPILPVAEKPAVSVGAANGAPVGGGIYYSPTSGKFTYRGAHLAAYTDNAGTTYAGESYVYPDNLYQATAAAGRVVGAPPFEIEFVTDSLFFQVPFTGTTAVAFRMLIDGQVVQAAISASFSGDTTAGSAVVNVANTAGLAAGQYVEGYGIPSQTTISSIVANTSVTLSSQATNTQTGTAMTAYTNPSSILAFGSGTPYSPVASIFIPQGSLGNPTQTHRFQFVLPGLEVKSGTLGQGGNAPGRMRRITLQWTGPFGGIYLKPQDSIQPSRTPPRKLLVLGDSYTGATGADRPMTGFAKALGHLLGMDVWASGLGGTGYLNAGSYTTLRNRLAADSYPWAPDAILVPMGINDNGFSAAAIQTEAAAVFDALKANHPGVPIYAIGAWQATGSPSAGLIAANTGVLAAANAANIAKVIDPTGWFTGTGNLGNRQINGNADHFITSDAIHPSQQGHEWLARLVAEQMVAA